MTYMPIVVTPHAKKLANNWGDPVAGGYTMGDLDGDGVVGPLDASILAAHWGYGTGGESNPVPEPSMLAMLIIVGMSFLAYGRRR